MSIIIPFFLIDVALIAILLYIRLSQKKKRKLRPNNLSQGMNNSYPLSLLPPEDPLQKQKRIRLLLTKSYTTGGAFGRCRWFPAEYFRKTQ